MSIDDGTTRPGASPDDPEQIRRQIERTQDALSQDVDALSEKVTPGRIVERRMERARGTASRWKDKVMGSNPGPGGGTARDTARDTVQGVAGSVSGSASAAATGVGDAASGAASTITSAVSEAPGYARRQAQGNPLAAGLIAFGAGWLISSLLPASEKEQRAATAVKEKASEHSDKITGPLGQAAENLREPVQQAADSIKSTATEAASTVKGETQSAAQDVTGQAKQAKDNVTEQTGGSNGSPISGSGSTYSS